MLLLIWKTIAVVFFDTKQIAFDYIFSKIDYMTARMLTDNPADKEVEDYLI